MVRFLKYLKPLLKQLLSLVSIENLKERVRTNFEYVVNDDEVVSDVMFGYDEKSPVTVIATNKHLYVLGDVVIHKVRKDEILEVIDYKGLVAKLVEVQALEETVYFKVYSKRAVKTLKEWAK